MLGNLEEGSRKRAFSLDWMLLGGEGNSMMGYFNHYYLKREKHPHVSQDRGIFGLFVCLFFFCGWDSILVCIQTCLWSGFVFVLSIMVTEWLCLMLVFCEIVYVQ